MRPRMAPSRSPSAKRNPHKALLQSLLRLCRDLTLTDRSRCASQRRNIASLARKSGLLLPLFEELHRGGELSHPAELCLAEILTVLRRFQTLINACSVRMSRMRSVLQFDTVSDQFHELTHDLASLLDILTLSELVVSEDVRDLVDLVRVQCRRSSPSLVDPAGEKLRSEILLMIEEIEREVVPQGSRMEELFHRLGLNNSQSCKEEISRLEIEIRDGSGGRWSAAMISLLGVVRYAKCVLFGASTPRHYDAADKGMHGFPSEDVIPTDFRCPISLELMRDPVVVASGQTYDRGSIRRWIDAGHATCPKTGQALSNLCLIPNLVLKNLIQQWCHDENIPNEVAEAPPSASKHDGVCWNKAALEAAKMTALFLVQKLSTSQSVNESNRIVHELRQLAKTGTENRAIIAEAGGILLLLPLLASEDPSLQVNSVTALLNLSILEANKKRIMKAPGGLPGIVRVLLSGATWQAKENAAATLLSLSSLHHVYRKRVGRESCVAEGLAELVRAGPTSSKRDGLITMLNLARDRENVNRLVVGGVIAAAIGAVRDPDVAEMAVAVLATLAKRGSAESVGEAQGFVAGMIAVMRQGTDLAKEAAVAALVSVCSLGGRGPLEELAATPGLELLLWGLMVSGSVRTRRKAESLGKIYRRWKASQQVEQVQQPQGGEYLASLGVVAPVHS